MVEKRTIGAAIEVLPPDAPREAWLAERMSGVGASEIAAVLGLSPWESPWSLWHRKADIIPQQEENESMRWGRRLERAILEEFTERHPELSIIRAGVCRNIKRDWQFTTPDGLAYDGATLVAPVQAKTTASLDHYGTEGTDGIPVGYRAQVLWEMDTFGAGCAYVPVLHNGRNYREYQIVLDGDARADLDVMRKAAREFLDSLARDEPPPIDAHTATTAALRTLHPDVEDRDVVVPDELAETYAEARRTAELAKADLDGATNELLAAIGDGRRAVTADGTRVATRIVSERRTLDAKALAADHPDIAEKYRRTTTVAQLRAAPAPKERKTIR